MSIFYFLAILCFNEALESRIDGVFPPEGSSIIFGKYQVKQPQGERAEYALREEVPADGVIAELALEHLVPKEERINAYEKYKCGGNTNDIL
jgi:hypothetical protein